MLSLANSLTLNFYIRSKVPAHVSAFQFLELPAPELKPAARKKLADFAAKLLQDPRAVPERAAQELFIARELSRLSLEDRQHRTGTFTFGGGESKAGLDEIIRQSLALWSKGRPGSLSPITSRLQSYHKSGNRFALHFRFHSRRSEVRNLSQRGTQ